MLHIENLHAGVNGNEILNGITLSVNAGEVHAIMGPNGSGKSTLAGVLAGKESYEVSQGTVTYMGKDLLTMAPEERAREGLFLAFQYPVEIPGVTNSYFLKASLNAIRKHRGLEELDAVEFLALVKQKMKIVELDQTLLSRPVNEGFSGGEKKRNEIFHMAVLEPKLAILDETDSGLDIDALRIVADGVNKLRSKDRAVIVVTHYQRLLDYIIPDFVHVLMDGQIVKSGGKDLALELEEKGYDWIKPAAERAGRRSKGPAGMTNTEKNMHTAQATTWYSEQFNILERRSNGDAASALHAMRKAAFAQFSDMGFPTTRNEEWRFTNLTPLTKLSFTLPDGKASVSAASIDPFILPGTTCRLVFVNGRYDAGLSSPVPLPAGIRAGSLAEALKRDEATVLPLLGSLAPLQGNAFTALQAAFLTDGAFIDVPDGVALDVPVELLFVAVPGPQPVAIQLRNIIRIGKGSRLSVVETYAGFVGGAYMTNVVSEIIVGDNGVLEHDKLQVENGAAFHIGSIYSRQGRDSVVTSNSIALGGSLVRNTVTATFGAPGSECTLNGLSLGTGEQLIDNHTVIDHAHPHCASHELYKAVLDGTSRGVFNGKIFVRPDAQKTDARQTNKTLLLSDGATIDTKPQLEIFADDVKCTHGATVGQLDEEQVFYLRARGIGEQDARDMLTYAFAADVVGRVHVDALRERLDDLLHLRLRQGRLSTVPS